MPLWEYRVVTIEAAQESDGLLGQKLTNIAQPSMHERGRAAGWEIFFVQGATNGDLRLFMKRPKTS